MKKISQVLNISQSTVQFIIQKCKEYGTTANLTRHGRKPKLTGRASRAFVREALANSGGAAEIHSSGGRICPQDNYRALRKSGFMEGWQKERHCSNNAMQFAISHVGDTINMWRKVLWSDETSFWPKCKMQCMAAHHPEYTIPTVKRGNSVMLWGCFSSAVTGKLVRVDGKMGGAKYRIILGEKLLQSGKDLRLGQRFTFQQVNDPKHTARATIEL